MKFSQLVLIERNTDQYIYGYHTGNGNCFRLSIEKAETLTDMLSCPEKLPSTVQDKLAELGFLVDEQIDEYKQIEFMLRQKHYVDSYLELIILPTEQCNFRCIYCYEDFRKPIMTQQTQSNILLYVEREIQKHKGLNVSWFGGEPLLAVSVIKFLSENFIEICRKHKKPYNASITTNGYLLNLQTFEKLREWKINHFQITLDGPSAIHDKQRVLKDGSPTFETILNNLCTIRDYAKGRMWNIALRTNATQPMAEYFDEYIEILNGQFKNDRRFAVQLRKMISYDSKENDKIIIEDNLFTDFRCACSAAEQFVSQEYNMTHGLNYVCYASKPYAFVIGSDGLIYKCTFGFDNPKNQIGSLKTGGDMEIDAAKLAAWLIPDPKKLMKCRRCNFLGACGGVSCPKNVGNAQCKKTISFYLPYLNKFYKIARNACDLTELF